MRAYQLAAAGLIGLVLSGCSTVQENPNTVGGAAIGAVAGGVIGQLAGHNAASTAIGAAVGGLIGGSIGNALDQADRQRARDAEMQALEYGNPGAPVSWRGDSGNYGTIVPGPAYARGGSPKCREFTHTIYVNGQPQTARGTACRNPDGTWSPIAG
ncbi:17 kDa surface antigen [Ancylobacter novellus DSM 506]|jgi:surface antigen|uniref:17 kDa surface antigen n=1 Tax=Ancylobacter novellus (strain ATCC 8093 / DSM 506 / JCM 20403 / CCM 1077 / IAM 12100 / NBRC 12443 / NCIMB 10456) TaxID=639283 RepID=D7A510_ANCN5|nr:glycine zipper domain-containing protein [Ancylobacter novellus]ADH88058.1 17 kDa surface antigen [Ancylobacter novellus DSM 506]MDF2621222.1 17 kDa surface antigen [Xanthobacteraceae bacterium]